jgi:hypothetical protein
MRKTNKLRQRKPKQKQGSRPSNPVLLSVIEPIPFASIPRQSHLVVPFLTQKEVKHLIDLGRQASSWDGTQMEKDEDLDRLPITGISLWLLPKLALMFANNNVWGVHVDGIVQDVFLQRYRVGQHTRMHVDCSDYHDAYSADFSKLTFVCMLQQPTKGGLTLVGEEQTPIVLKPGEGILYPSYRSHGVSKVEAGERLVLTAWANGPGWV